MQVFRAQIYIRIGSAIPSSLAVVRDRKVRRISAREIFSECEDNYTRKSYHQSLWERLYSRKLNYVSHDPEEVFL